ncbi:chemotaxis protein CheW [Desulfoplanes sp.]
MTHISDQFLTFVLEEEVFGIDIGSVKEILELPKITKLPQTDEDMLGVINLREHAVPVFDLRTKFNLPPKEDSVDTSIIIMDLENGKNAKTFGVKVDGVQEVVGIGQEDMEPVPASGMSVDNRFIKQIGRLENGFVIILDGARIISEDEMRIETPIEGTSYYGETLT